MKKHYGLLALISFTSCAFVGTHRGETILDDPSVNLAGQRSPGIMLYQFSTDYLSYAPDGSLVSKEQTVVEIEIEVDGTGRQTLTAHKFELIDKDGLRMSIPRLEGWQNTMDSDSDEVLGVPHADFAGLHTDTGEPLSPEIAHRVYNTFVDFYAFNNVFAQPSPAEGKDIGDLTSIGQVIEHYSAYSRPSVSLGEAVAEGSYFQNGRVTLEWKGMSRVGGNACALVGFDSGESEFRMALQPAPGMKLTVNGGSQYWGDLHINTESLWLEKGTFTEIVLARMQFGDDPPVDTVIKRIGHIVN
jgi:hypothetical protein